MVSNYAAIMLCPDQIRSLKCDHFREAALNDFK